MHAINLGTYCSFRIACVIAHDGVFLRDNLYEK